MMRWKNEINRRQWTQILLVAVVALALIDLYWSRPAEHALAALQEVSHRDESASRQTTGMSSLTESDAVADYFINVVADTPISKDWAVIINELPARFGLRLGAMSFEEVATGIPTMYQHTVRFDVSGRFINFMFFLEGLKETLPTVSIDSLKVSRSHIRSTDVSVALTLLVLSIDEPSRQSGKGDDVRLTNAFSSLSDAEEEAR